MHRSRSQARIRRRRAALAGGLVLLAAAVVAVILLSSSSTKPPPRQMESILQDDQFLLYEPTRVVARTLDTLRSIGVDRVRVTVLWLTIAPDPASTKRPRHFNATNPSAYPRAGWAPYDRLVELAAARGIAVDFNVTAPGPLWAMFHPAPSVRYLTHYRPSAAEFRAFVEAVGRRYSGSWRVHGPGLGSTNLPRVSFWTIWNEPNQPGWLAPQWRSQAGVRVVDSPRLYRAYVDAGFAALQQTGHSPDTDTVLIGELAPEGSEASSDEAPVPPMPFLRALYCVGPDYKPLRGPRTGLLHCPAGDDPAQFVKAHPGLFQATGFAHHPYAFFLAPTVSMSDPNFVPLADIGRLEQGLDRIFSAYGVQRQLPIYITEYGYETDPPDPFRGVSPGKQAQYLNQAQYLAWKDPRIRSMAQFLLIDSAPNTNFPRASVGYWSSFQTGLIYFHGSAKPALTAYELPLVLPVSTFAAGQKLLVWAMLRAAPNNTSQHAQLQWRPAGGGFRTIAQLTTSDPSGFVMANASFPGSGAVRVAWTRPGAAVVYSRVVRIQQTG